MSVENLSKREKEAFNLILKGMNNRQIAEKMEIEYYTAKEFVRRMLKKLSLKSKNEVMAKYLSKK